MGFLSGSPCARSVTGEAKTLGDKAAAVRKGFDDYKIAFTSTTGAKMLKDELHMNYKDFKSLAEDLQQRRRKNRPRRSR